MLDLELDVWPCLGFVDYCGAHKPWMFLVELGFKVHRGFEAERAVEPHAVVKGFDLLEDGRARRRAWRTGSDG